MNKMGIAIIGVIIILAVTLIACLVETFSYRSWSAGMELDYSWDEDEDTKV